jgi:hypothetical protein
MDGYSLEVKKEKSEDLKSNYKHFKKQLKTNTYLQFKDAGVDFKTG